MSTSFLDLVNNTVKEADQARLKMCIDICKEIADEFQKQEKDQFGRMATTGARACENELRKLLIQIG